MTPEFEERLKKAVDDGLLPNVVVLAKDKSGTHPPQFPISPPLSHHTTTDHPPTGKIDYSFSHGPTALVPDADPVTPFTLFTMASMSKLITSLCVLLLIQDNFLKVDDDISRYVPELTEQPVLTGFDADGKPQYTERKGPITVRHLLTHTAGAGYILMDERLARWAKATGKKLPLPLRHGEDRKVAPSLETRFAYPLLFEPGEGWVYGTGLDWAGRLLEKLTGAFFDDFVAERVLDPVGVAKGGITFHPGRFMPSEQLIAGMSKRNPQTGKVEFMETEIDNEGDALGGEGLFGGMGEYMKVLYSLLMDDGKIVKPELAKLLFQGFLKPTEKEALNKSMETPEWAVGVIPKADYDWSLGGLLTTHDVGHRKKGFLQWGGAWNMAWVSSKPHS